MTSRQPDFNHNADANIPRNNFFLLYKILKFKSTVFLLKIVESASKYAKPITEYSEKADSDSDSGNNRAPLPFQLQHTYLQTAILRELSTFAPASMPSPLYSVLRKHRHAVSEPAGYIGNPFLNKSSPSVSERACLHADNGKKSNRKKSSNEQSKDDGAQLRNSGHGRSSLRQRNAPNLKSVPCDIDSALADCSDSGVDRAEDKVNGNADNSVSNEVDSPSEGYHSQQSSGSPTPSSERSSLHFPEGEHQISAAPPSPQITACPVNSPGKTILTKVVDV